MNDDDYVVRSNITRFERMLQKEQDPKRRATMSVLLAEERRKLEARQPGRPKHPQ